MSVFLATPKSVRFYTRAECPDCQGIGLVSSTMRTTAGDGFRVIIRFCKCATMFTVSKAGEEHQ